MATSRGSMPVVMAPIMPPKSGGKNNYKPVKKSPGTPISKPVSTKPSDTKMARSKAKTKVQPVKKAAPKIPAINPKGIGTKSGSRRPDIAMY